MKYISSEKERCVILASYLVENQTTVRAVASKFGISKSTVHKDITKNLKNINHPLYCEVQKVVPYPLSLVIYIVGFTAAAYIILGIAILCKKIFGKKTAPKKEEVTV